MWIITSFGMDNQQLEAVSLIDAGHNLLLTGQAGTGKSFTIKHCVDKLRNSGKNVALTCYTGIACRQYPNMNATTLHKFCGLEDGRHSNDELLQLITSDERFQSTKLRIQSTDVLIIDEVSMVSKKILEQVEFICRQLRNNTCFGSIQTILCGDFYQLSPIKDELYGDFGHYCFQSCFFSSMFPHHLNLTTVHRQTDLNLMTAINELEKGQPSEITNQFIKSLSRPFSKERADECVKLFARNLDVDIYNYEQLSLLGGQLHTFNAEDNGDVHYLNKMLAPKILGLKVSAPVMLLRNLSDNLVNGLQGHIVEIGVNNITVDFEGELAHISRYCFTKIDPITKQCVARRLQFPLKLSYAITIHKSQGMTLPLVQVDCKNARQPGQVGVAVGRAKSVDGLRVLNYNPSLLTRHLSQVYEFYESLSYHSPSELESLDCCKNVSIGSPDITHDNRDTHEQMSDSDFSELNDSEQFIMSLNETEAQSDHLYCAKHDEEDVTVTNVFKRAFTDFAGTPSEEEAQKAFDMIMKNKSKTNEWYHQQCKVTNDLLELSCEGKSCNLKQKNFTNFYSKFQAYLNSQEYVLSTKNFGNHGMVQYILSSVMFVIQADLLKSLAESVNKEQNVINISPPIEKDVSSAGRGKVRYIGGYVIAKTRYRLSQVMRNNLFVPGMEAEVKNIKDQLHILDRMTVSASEIMQTSVYEETLKETMRKQNLSESLTNINDKMFEFFEMMEFKVRSLLTYQTLVEHRKYLYHYVRDEILGDYSILEFFCRCYCYIRTPEEEVAENVSCDLIVNEICFKLTATCSHLEVILRKIVSLFLSVSISQFRKDYLTAIQREKGKALRKKVTEKKARVSSVQGLDMQFIKDDKSQNKMVSHLKLKACAHENKNFYTDFTKSDLNKLLKAYNINMSMKKTKREMGTALVDILKETSEMSNPNELSSAMISKGDDDKASSYVPVREQIAGSSQSESVVVPLDEVDPGCLSVDEESCSTSKPSTSSAATKKDSKLSKKRKNTRSYKKKGKTKGRKTDVNTDGNGDDKCGVCFKSHNESEDWICCDMCSIWYHRICVNLEDNVEWNKLSADDAIYNCPMCL